jgi:hypothetical protein
MGQRTRNLWLVAALLLLGCAVVPTVAQAGRYHVYSCRTPDGATAPVDGWSGTLAPGGAPDDYVENTCASGGALIAALGDETTHLASVDRATWALEVPSFDHLVEASVVRTGDTDGGGTGNSTYQFWLSAPRITSVFDQCVATLGCQAEGVPAEPLSGVNRLAVPAADLGSQILASVGCGGAREPEAFSCPKGQGDANNYAAALYLYGADLTLEQTAGPSVSAVAGDLATAPVVSGTSDLTFNAADPGAGVYEAIFTVDGRVVRTSTIDEEGGRCRDVGQTGDGLPAFLYLQPCPSSVNADLGFDTTGLPDGAHHLVVTVVDAAGNSATVLDRTITLANSPANGRGASTAAVLSARWQRTRGTRLTSAFGRSQTITGRLLAPGGVPIAGAQIAVSATPSYAGASSSAMRGAVTGSDGSFVLKLTPRLSSRTIALSYTAHADESQPVTVRKLKLAVRAPMSVRITPRRAPSEGTIRFHGRLLAGPVPRGGKPVILEARSGGGPWIEFHVIRTDRRGRFSSSYRFKFPGPAVYQFRILCEQEADYPYAAGSSRVLTVSER